MSVVDTLPDLSGSAIATGRRVALLVAVGRFSDESLPDLPSSVNDVRSLAEVLADPAIGGFEVQTIVDADKSQLVAAVYDFFAQRERSDLALFYLSTHGLLDAGGRLYFAAVDTQRGKLPPTALQAEFLREQMDACPARSQVLLLEASFSGAFMRGAK